MEMEQKYGITDLKEMPIFPSIPQTQTPCDLHYAMVMLGGGDGGGISFGSDSTMGINIISSSSAATSDSGGNINGLDMEIGDFGTGRWPKEETRTLLEIRSRLDSKFKEANHKGPLWDEVSRIMSLEHGYKRSGKKCSEKFENLYKYYKKIKEGKCGRQQNRKHYRFFRHLEALYGETSTSININPNPNPNPPSISNLNIGTHDTIQANPHLPNHNPSMFNSSSCHYINHDAMVPSNSFGDCVERTINDKRRLGRKRWKTTITDFIETKVQTLMEKQEAWMQKMMKTIDEKEKERISKEERWRKEEAARYEMENKFRANERAWMESRDSALMEALLELTAKEGNVRNQNDHKYDKIGDNSVSNWEENEITQLIHLRRSMETRFEEGGMSMEEVLWEEIALRMACLGYNNRNALTCKAKWDDVNFLLRTKKQKQKSRCSNVSSDNHQNYNIFDHEAGEIRGADHPRNDDHGGYRVLINEDWNCYGTKTANGEEH